MNTVAGYAFERAPAPGPWSEHGACRAEPTDLFFAERQPQIREAIAVCGFCPVRDDCFAYAIALPALEGIWGATTTSERDQIRRRARRTQGATA